jgi:DNA-binding CsgD family transcriptional regulator/DNA-binding Xre family transcriptional regulator
MNKQLEIAAERAVIANKFGAKVRALRTNAGLTTDQLGQRCGLVGSTISKVEHGRPEPRLWLIVQICRGLGVTPNDLIEMSRPAVGGDLTPRETEVLWHLTQGRSYADIAADLHIAIETVRTHARRVRRKRGVSTSREFLGDIDGE